MDQQAVLFWIAGGLMFLSVRLSLRMLRTGIARVRRGEGFFEDRVHYCTWCPTYVPEGLRRGGYCSQECETAHEAELAASAW